MTLQASNLSFKYFEQSKKDILSNINLTFESNKTTLVVGASGSGKSTLAYILAGLYPEATGFLTSGKVEVDGVHIHELTPNKRAHYVSMMFQNPDFQFCMDTLENELRFCLENIATPEAEIEARSMDAINKLDIQHLFKKPFKQMSGGEKQKSALACTLALGSKVIILDEAFANIDTPSTLELIKMISALDLTVIAIDHNLDLWEGHYDHIISLDGTYPKVFDLQLPAESLGEPLVESRNLVIGEIEYPDFVVRKGSLTAIIGPSGSGKTTFFKGLIKQKKYDGSLTIAGKEVEKMRPKQLFKEVGLVFQNPANQFLALTTYDEVLFSVQQAFQDKKEDFHRAKAIQLLELFGLEKHAKHSPYLLSAGQQRRLAVLTMLAGDQEVLLLDEPTYGQDYENISALMNLLKERAEAGLTVIFATHNLHIAHQFSHDVIDFSGGS